MEYAHVHVDQTTKQCFATEQLNKRTEAVPKPTAILNLCE